MTALDMEVKRRRRLKNAQRREGKFPTGDAMDGL